MFDMHLRISRLVPLLILCLAGQLAAGKLDIEGRDLTGQDIKQYGGLVQHGVLVAKSTGNALAAGIIEGDVVVAVNGAEVSGIFEMEEVLRSIRGKKFDVVVKRVATRGLLKVDTLSYAISSPIDLQVRKAYTLNLGDESPVKVGKYRGQTLLLWYANRVWIYDKTLQKESFVSLIKVYSVSEHKTYRYTVPAKVIFADFLTPDGLLVYVSTAKSGSKVGVVDIETSERQVNWSFEVNPIEDRIWDIAFSDINGDSIPEIYFSMDARVTCLDGVTGNVVWVRDDLSTYYNHQRTIGEKDYADIMVDDFTRDGAREVAVGPLLLNAATGEKKSYLSFDPVKFDGGIIECRQLLGDPIPDILSGGGLHDGNSGEKVWEPLRSRDYFLADLSGDGQLEIIYLLKDQKLHVHDIASHKELYSIPVDGALNLVLQDFNNDNYADFLVRQDKTAYLYQTNIPMANMPPVEQRGVGYAASLLDFGLKKDKFYVFGRELYQAGDFAGSVPLFLRAMAENPDREDTVKYLATAFIKTRNFEGALSLLKEKKNVYAREVLNQFSSEIVSFLLDRNETNQAISFLEMKKDADPLLLSRCYLAIGKPEVAVKLMTDMKEKPTEAQLLLGKAYVLMNKMISARIAFKNYLKFYPTSAEGWQELGQLEVYEKNWDDAEEAFKICKDLDEVLGTVSLSALYMKESKKKNMEHALKLARQAHRLEPSSRTKIQLANVMVEMDNYDEAGLILSQIEDPGVEFNRFEMLQQRAQYQIQAIKKYDEAEKLRLSPVFKKRNLVSAVEMYEEIITRYPKSTVVASSHFNLGEIYLDPENRDEDKAMHHFNEVIRMGDPLSARASEQIRLLKGGTPAETPVPEDDSIQSLKVRALKPQTINAEPELETPVMDAAPVIDKKTGFEGEQKESRAANPLAELERKPDNERRAKGKFKEYKSSPFTNLMIKDKDDEDAGLNEKMTPPSDEEEAPAERPVAEESRGRSTRTAE